MSWSSRIGAAALALVALCGVAAAQSPAASGSPAAQTPSAIAASPAPADFTKKGLLKMKVVRERCRGEIQAGGLKGEARRQAMGECVVKARPDKASQVRCAMDPQTKGMDREARRAFVKDCASRAKT